jgi:NAD(P)H dehydrogenase (quinone)
VHSSGAWDAIHQLFDLHVAQVCGMTPVGHLHFGEIVEDAREDAISDCLKGVRSAVRDWFGT